MEKHFVPSAVAQKVVLFNHQGRVLAVRQSGNNKYGHTFWDLPGGRVNEGEDFEAAIRREVEEETGIRPTCLQHFRTEPGVFPSGDPNVLISYTAFARIDPKLSSEHSNYDWVDPKDVGERQWMFKQMPEWIANAQRPQSRGAMCIVENEGKVLLLKRSSKVAGWSGWYYGISGSIEDGETAESTVLRELEEETGLSKDEAEIVRAGEPFKTSDFHTVFPFLVRSKHRDIKLNWEHDEAMWVDPAKPLDCNVVPFFVFAARNLGLDLAVKTKSTGCVVLNNGKLLLLRRSSNVGTHRGAWGVVAGYVEPHENPQETAFKEISEELGLQPWQFKLVKSGEPRMRTSEGITYTMFPFLFETAENEISLDWEHDEYRWINPSELNSFELTPGLDQVLESLAISKIRQEA